MLKNILSWFWKLAIISIIAVIVMYIAVDSYSEDYLFDDINELPTNRAGILLGTSKYVPQGGINQFYQYRIDAAVALYRSGKIKKIIASGDNGSQYYNEPVKMQGDLMKRGIPEKDIKLDYAGFSTLDAMVRAEAIFSQKSFTVISQEFHNSRAVFIAREKGIDAVAYNAQDVAEGRGLMTHFREYMARVKMFLDLYVLHTEPKFYGDKVRV